MLLRHGRLSIRGELSLPPLLSRRLQRRCTNNEPPANFNSSKSSSSIQHTQRNAPSPATTKSKMCSRYNIAEGCKFGDKCHFAHNAWELGKPSIQEPVRTLGSLPSRFGGPPPPPSVAGASFGASATAKISVDASLTGAIIGKGGVNSKQISRQTGVRLAIRDHEGDSNLKNIELEGTFEQIKEASVMVRELIMSANPAAGGLTVKPPVVTGPAAGNYKTKVCENFGKGSCTVGERCHFAHGAAELRKSGV